MALMAAGTLAAGASYLVHKDRFSSESIFQRQRPAIERVLLDDEELGQERYRQLREGLSRVENSSISEKCRFEHTFQGIMEHGSEEAARQKALRENYRPHHDCDTMPQITDASQHWYGWMGIAGIVGMFTGLLGFARSLRKRVKVPDL